MSGTEGPGDLAVGKVHRGLPDGVGHSGLHQRRVHHLPLAGFQSVDVCRHRAVGTEEAGSQVGDGHPDLGWRRIGVAGNAHQPADALGHQVEPAAVAGRASAAESGNGAVNQAGLDVAQIGIVQPHPFHHAGPEILNHHVSAFHQAAKKRRGPRHS